MPQERIEIQLPSRLWYIEPILSLLRQLAERLGFCQERVADIQLVIDEICGNAIEHGSESDNNEITIRFILDEHQLAVLIRDKGTNGKENWLTSEKLKEISQKRAPDRERGHGIYMAEQLADELKMEPNSFGGTDVRVVFNRPIGDRRLRNSDPSNKSDS